MRRIAGVPGSNLRWCAWATAGLLVLFAARADGQVIPPAEPPQVDRTMAANGWLPEPGIIVRAIDFATRTIGDGSSRKSGFFPDLGNMPTGAGWISAGPGYRQWIGGDRAIVEASAGWSWRGYKMAQARFELTNLARSRLAIGSQLRWQDLTQVTYFGTGADAPAANRSEYRLTSINVAGYVTFRPAEHVAITARVGYLPGPSIDAPAGTFKRGNPDTRQVFPADPVYAVATQPDLVHGELSMTVDDRDARSHPTRGGVYRAASTTYNDLRTGTFSFRRYELEAARFIPLMDARWVLAFHGWSVMTNVDNRAEVPFYLLPSLGGANTLRGFPDYRFHDLHLLLTTAEARFALFDHVDLAAFVDAGSVAARIRQLDLGARSYGLGVRLHSGRATFLRIDAAHGREGWNVLLRLGDPLHLSRLSRRLAALPFVP
jgi:hypothetical protein